MNRRDLLGSIALGGGATLLASRDALAEALAPKPAPPTRRRCAAPAPVKIRDIKTILTAPNRIRLVVVKVETTEPGLFGWGCATFTQRALVVQTAIDQYLKPFLIGRNVDEIEDIWQSSYVSSYWRNGRVLFNAMSGVDIALWDIKGKRAGMPLYQLLGGKVRHGADCYYHASGASFTEVEESARRGDGAGLPPRPRAGVDARAMPATARAAPRRRAGRRGRTRPSARPIRAPSGSRRRTCGCCPSSSSTCARKLGDEVELLHDVHERITLNQAINLCKALEPYRLFFLEDPFPPEDNDHFRLLRQQTSIPIAMGELFNTQHEYLPLIKERLIDFIRIHISQIGGLSPARKVAALVRVLRRAHRLARPGRRLARRARRAARPRARQLQLRHPRRQQLPEGDAGGVRRLPGGEERLHAGAGKARATASRSTRSWRRSSRSRPDRRTSTTRGARRGAATAR